MGNSEPKHPNLRIYIETQKQFYTSGSFITGVIFIQALQDFNFDALYIRVQGYEWCQWFQGSSKNRKKYKGDSNFYVIQHMIERYHDKLLEQGKYAYPFSVQISQNIPGIFESSSPDAKITYKLKAYFTDYQNKKNKQSYEIPLIIIQPFRQEVAVVNGSMKTNPKTWGCCSQGEVGLSVSFSSKQSQQIVENVCFEEENVKIKGTVNNNYGARIIKDIRVELVQYTFMCSNNGVHRTYRKVEYSDLVDVNVDKEQQKEFEYQMKIPKIKNQTSISTLVGNYYRLQVSTEIGLFSRENPCIISPLFIMKKVFNQENTVPKKMNLNQSSYKIEKIQCFKAPEYWFRKNRYLDVMNFKIGDIAQTNHQAFS